jgi:hypothetical protein
MIPKYRHMEIRWCVHFPPDDGADDARGHIESYDTADEAEREVWRAVDFRGGGVQQFVGLYVRVPDDDVDSLPAGLLQHIGDWDSYEAARDMLDVLTGSTAEQRAAAGDVNVYRPAPVPSKGYDEQQALAALCIWEAMLEIRDDVPALDKQWEDEGTCAMRAVALELAPIWEASYNTLSEDERDTYSYDWEFVPAFVVLEYETDGGGALSRAGLSPAEIGRRVFDRTDRTYKAGKEHVATDGQVTA